MVAEPPPKPAGTQIPLRLIEGAQREFVLSSAMHPALLGGRGSGKTMASLIKGFMLAGTHPGILGVLTEPTYRDTRDTFLPAFRSQFGSVEGQIWNFKRADMEIRLTNGSTILLRPAAEADKLRGPTFAFFGMDEVASKEQLESFLILQAALRQGGDAGVQQGWVTSTPHWRKPWIRKIWQDGVNPTTGAKLNRADYPIFRASTYDNKFLPSNFMDRIRALAPGERYTRQELYGEFIDLEGVAFPQFSERTHVRMPPEGMKVVRRCIGVDFGGTVPTAVEEFCLLENGDIQGTYEFYERECSDKQLVTAIADRPRCKVLCDSSGEMQIEQLRRYGINANKARVKSFPARKSIWNSRLALTNRATGKVYALGAPGAENARPGIYLSPLQANLIAELESLAHASIRGTEILKDEWEQGLDDHAYDAGAYCLADLDPAVTNIRPITVSGPGLGFGR